MAQIKCFGVFQTAKFVAILYFIFTALFLIPFGLFFMVAGTAFGDDVGIFGALFGGVFILFLPVIYGVIGFVFVAIGCLIYNLLAKYVGGIELEIK